MGAKFSRPLYLVLIDGLKIKMNCCQNASVPIRLIYLRQKQIFVNHQQKNKNKCMKLVCFDTHTQHKTKQVGMLVPQPTNISTTRLQKDNQSHWTYAYK